jgi:amino acid transporter
MIVSYIFIAFLIILCVAISLLVYSGKYIIKNKRNKQENYNGKNRIKYFISIIGLLIGILLVLILIYIFFIDAFPVEITRTEYITKNAAKEVENIIRIEQLVGNSIDHSKTRYGFFKTYEAGFPFRYYIKFINISDISEQIKRVKFNSLIFILNGTRREIIDDDNISDIWIYVSREHRGWNIDKEEIRPFIETREIELEENYDDKFKNFQFVYNWRIDFETIEYFTVIYNIDIELRNGRIINVEEISNFNKEIIIEK